MAIKRRGDVVKSNSTTTIKNLEAGEHEGRLRYVADLGLHEREWKGEKKSDVQKLSLGIEIVGETVEIDGEQQPRLLWLNPFNIFDTLSDQGAELGIFKTFSTAAKEGDVADWDSVINEPCNVLVKHTKGKGDNADRTFDNIDTLSPIPKKYQKDVEQGLITDGCTGDADDEDNPAQKAMYGLVSWMFDQRVEEVMAVPKLPPNGYSDARFPSSSDDDDIPF